MRVKLFSTLAFIVFILIWITLLSAVQPLLIQTTIFGNFFTDIGFIVFAVFLAPLTEELVFRKVPLDFARQLKTKTGFDAHMYIAIISSFIFGYIHDGPFNIVLQGIGGFALSMLYIKTGYKYWWNVLAHMGWNAGVMYVLPFFEKIW